MENKVPSPAWAICRARESIIPRMVNANLFDRSNQNIIIDFVPFEGAAARDIFRSEYRI